MSDAKHTPGEWAVNVPVTGPRASSVVALDFSGVPGHDRYLVVGSGERLVCIVPHGEGDPAADARLIAAAPRMYDYIARMAEKGDQDAAAIIAAVGAG